jgi:ABC-2 type transport system ATP-binding protein
MASVIRTENISKHYKDVCAVSEVSINVEKGEIYGFLGLNGAGKTTTIRMLLGMINPTKGTAYLNEQKVSNNSPGLWKSVGALVEIPYSYPELSVRENLEILRRLHSIKNPDAVSRITRLLHLGQYSDRKVKNLSLGNNQRLGLAKALIHEPEILILDEPTNGLDPAGIYEIRELLCDLAANKGVTIFISSHILDEIARFATRIGIIHQGKLIQEINANQLELLSDKRLRLSTKNNSKAKTILENTGFQVNTTPDNELELKDSKAIENPDTIAALLVNESCSPTLLVVEEEDLEAYFLRAVGMKGGVR